MVLVFLKLTVANLYYNQPLLETMRQSLGATELQANLITFITQLGYALGLVFVVPLADKVSRRKIVLLNMSIAVACCITIALAHSIWIVWGASIILGCNSVVPQMFIPVANHFSKPEDKSRNMGRSNGSQRYRKIHPTLRHRTLLLRRNHPAIHCMGLCHIPVGHLCRSHYCHHTC